MHAWEHDKNWLLPQPASKQPVCPSVFSSLSTHARHSVSQYSASGMPSPRVATPAAAEGLLVVERDSVAEMAAGAVLIALLLLVVVVPLVLEVIEMAVGAVLIALLLLVVVVPLVLDVAEDVVRAVRAALVVLVVVVVPLVVTVVLVVVVPSVAVVETASVELVEDIVLVGPVVFSDGGDAVRTQCCAPIHTRVGVDLLQSSQYLPRNSRAEKIQSRSVRRDHGSECRNALLRDTISLSKTHAFVYDVCLHTIKGRRRKKTHATVTYPSAIIQTKLLQLGFEVHSEAHLREEYPRSSVFPFDNLTSAVPLIEVSVVQVYRVVSVAVSLAASEMLFPHSHGCSITDHGSFSISSLTEPLFGS